MREIIQQARALRRDMIEEMKKAEMVKEKFESVWTWVTEEERRELDKESSERGDTHVVAIDGSRRFQEFQVHVPFYVKAVAIRYPSTIGGHIYDSKEWLGLIKPPEMGKERSLIYMEAQEAAIAINALRRMEEDGIRFILADGSFSVPVNCDGQMSQCVLKGLEDLDVQEFMRCVWRNHNDVNEARRVECEYKRRLYALAAKEGIGRVVYVAKKYYSKQLFNFELEDAQIIEALSKLMKKEVGYTLPKTKKLKVGKETITLTYSYVRLSKNGPILYIEIPGEIDNGLFRRILGVLFHYTINGYPRPLAAAHKHSQITENAWENSLIEMGLFYEKTGREAL